VWLVAQEGIAICFRCRDDKVFVEIVSPRHFVGELPSPRLGTQVFLNHPTFAESGDAPFSIL
jgi:hypothetical protein